MTFSRDFKRLNLSEQTLQRLDLDLDQRHAAEISRRPQSVFRDDLRISYPRYPPILLAVMSVSLLVFVQDQDNTECYLGLGSL